MDQNKQIVQVVEEAFQMVPELAIQVEEPVEACVRKLATGVCDARAEMARVQLELNLQLTKLQLRAQLSTLSKVREQHTTMVTTSIMMVDSAVINYMKLFEQSFEVLTTLQENPNIERPETKVHKLQ